MTCMPVLSENNLACLKSGSNWDDPIELENTATSSSKIFLHNSTLFYLKFKITNLLIEYYGNRKMQRLGIWCSQRIIFIEANCPNSVNIP